MSPSNVILFAVWQCLGCLGTERGKLRAAILTIPQGGCEGPAARKCGKRFVNCGMLAKTRSAGYGQTLLQRVMIMSELQWSSP